MTRRQLLLSAITAANLRAFQGETTSLKLASVVNGITFRSLPPVAVKHAKMILASTLASAAAGLDIDSVRIIRELVEDQAGEPSSRIWFASAQVPVAEAARANAMASDAAASDDSYLRNVAHIGTSLTAVGLAMGENVDASGEDLLAAMVGGYEAAGRIGEAIAASMETSSNAGAITASIGRGFHASATVAFGGTVTAAKLLGLSDMELANALGITATTVGGLSISSNSAAREYHAGNAALTAVNAVMAASRGYTVNPNMLEAPGGFLAVFGGGEPDPEALERELNGNYEIAQYLAVKLLPGAHALHAAVEAAVNAAKQMPGSPDDVTEILVAGPQSGLASTPAPKDVIQAIHSLPYYLATAVADREFTWRHTDPQLIERPMIGRLIELVDADPNPPAIAYDNNWSATVTIVTKGGQRYASTVQAPRGSAPRGIEWGDIDAKYHALTPQSGLPTSQLEQALDLIHDFEDVENVATLTRTIVPGR